MTAVEWLVKELENVKALQFYQEIIVEKAKEMEKEQLNEAFKTGQESTYRLS